MAKKSKSALKAHRQNIARRERNRQLRSKLRTGLKRIRTAVAASDAHGADAHGAEAQWKEAQALVDTMAAKGIIHRNTAARHKARLAARLSK